jgi:hypothetical protein
MSRICSTNGEKSNPYRIFVEKIEGKRPLGRPKPRWKDNIEIGLRDIAWGGIDWIHVDQDRNKWRALLNRIMNLRVP